MIGASLFAEFLPRIGLGTLLPAHADRQLVASIQELSIELLQSGRCERSAQVDANQVRGWNRSALRTCFASVVAAMKQTLGVELYDVQLSAGLAMSRGAIVEMQTGEGKTFAAVLPAVWHAVSRPRQSGSVHVMTTNHYLAQRDCENLRPVYEALGLSVSWIATEMTAEQKAKAYQCDVVYGPGEEFGFDFLREQIAQTHGNPRRLGASFREQWRSTAPVPVVERPLKFYAAIVDEADSVLLDGATTPLVLAMGSNREVTDDPSYHWAAQIAGALCVNQDYAVDLHAHTIALTRLGCQRIAEQTRNLSRAKLRRPWETYVLQALTAQHLLRRDVDFLVAGRKIQLIDCHTGRIHAERSWHSGLLQAVQVHEGVPLTEETSTVARITRQRFLSLYEHFSGMTGTAAGSEHELQKIYGKAVHQVPSRLPSRRIALPCQGFATRDAKEQAIIAEIADLQSTGRPILVGTASIDSSERLAQKLDACGIHYQLLNGKQDAQEATVVAHAGSPKTVTLATNLAGRGTDIKLPAAVIAAGGLHVIVAEPQGSRRIDRQLIGRSGRQGEPGSYRIYVSAEDEVVKKFGPRFAQWLQGCNNQSPTEDQRIRMMLQAVQKRSEMAASQKRQELFLHDDWLQSLGQSCSPSTFS